MDNLELINFWNVILMLASGYVLGSIPSSVWIGRALHDIDVREHGSLNAGATNTFRVLGKGVGTAVLTLDILKGFFAVYFGKFILDSTTYQVNPNLWLILAGIMAVIGHLYPVFAGFRGGKGVATSLGMVLCIHPEAALCALAVFVLIFISTGYVSAGSIIASLSFPVFLLIKLFGPESPILIIFGFMMFILVVYTHRKNVVRLLNGNENRFYILRKKPQ
jgi:glycerol-3-phosphate acyltransferase PlsY